MNDKKYWNKNTPEKWDWSAGLFSKVLSECLPNINIDTIDISSEHIERCKYINENNENINYIKSTSEEYLKNYQGKLDVIYLDTGDMTPVEDTALLQLIEANQIEYIQKIYNAKFEYIGYKRYRA